MATPSVGYYPTSSSFRLQQYATASSYIRTALWGFLIYFLAAKLGFFLFFSFKTTPAIIWPPAGVGLALVLVYGYRMWVPIFVAYLFAAITTVQLGFSVSTFVGAIAYTVSPLVVAHIMRRFRFENNLNTLRNTIIMIGAAFFLTTIAPSLNFLLDAAFGAVPWSRIFILITRSWAGGIFSMLIILPLVLTWRWPFRNTYGYREVVEIVAALALLIVSDILIFWTPFAAYLGVTVIFVIPALLIWFALRLSPRWTSLAVFITAAVGLAGSIIAHPGAVSLNQQLLSDQIYIGMVAAIFYVFVAVVEDRRVAYKVLAASNSELQKVLERVRREDEAKTEFLAILAHELRNPLAPVVSSLELLRMRAEETNQSDLLEILDIADTHNRAITRLLDDLLDISRITRKKFKLQKGPVELHALVQGAVRTVDPFYKSSKHTLELRVPEKEIWFEGDEIRLGQILVNLLYNAAKYTKPGGKVTLSASYDDVQGLRLSVRDNGMGIPQHMLERVFEPFVQLPKTGEKVGTGLGIGLALTKRLVELHEGDVWVESEGEGKGSEFIVTLPLKGGPRLPLRKNEATIPERLMDDSGGVVKDILVVDDNEAAAKGLALLLSHRGHTVSSVFDGQSAIAYMREHPAEVVLLDIGLPDIDGYEVGQTLRSMQGDKPLFLIALTGYGLEEDKAKAKKAGFDVHLTKPVGLRDIERVFAAHFGAQAEENIVHMRF